MIVAKKYEYTRYFLSRRATCKMYLKSYIATVVSRNRKVRNSPWAKWCKTYFGSHIFTTMILVARIIEVKRKNRNLIVVEEATGPKSL